MTLKHPTNCGVLAGMTRYFEVLRRDGPARMGKLLLERQISTPGLLSKDDYLSAGSVYSYQTIQQAVSASEALKDQKKLAIPAYVPASSRSEPAIDLPPFDTDGPKGLMIHPKSSKPPERADVYLLGSGPALKNPRELVAALVNVREAIAPDSALYAPAIATPANLGLLVYLGVDLFDGVRMIRSLSHPRWRLECDRSDRASVPLSELPGDGRG